MIPKKIHYVWVGGNPIPKQFQAYINKWSELMPEWEIIRHDETSFDISSSLFCKQAFEAKRWAFVSDYIRVKVLYEQGGIYLDTDEDMQQPLDCFVNHKAFFGMENGNTLQAGVFGCEPKNEIIGQILKYYDSIDYIVNGKQNNTVIGSHFFHVIQSFYPSIQLKEEIQEIGSGIFIYPSVYFCPDIRKPLKDSNTYTIHRYAATWYTPSQKLKRKFINLIGVERAQFFVKIKRVVNKYI